MGAMRIAKFGPCGWYKSRKLPALLGYAAGLTILAIGVPILAAPAAAGEPSAIVEEVAAPDAGINVMDYVSHDRVIQLARGETVTLGYLRSCLRETITGGRIVVGLEQSRVENGSVRRERVECDGGALKLGAAESGKSLVLVLRAPRASAGTPAPTVTIFGASPVIKLRDGAGEVEIERLDRRAGKLSLMAANGFIDLAATGHSLQPGGLYRARSGGREVVFQVDRLARPGPGPVIGRLVPF
jgi:hypothetical protein